LGLAKIFSDWFTFGEDEFTLKTVFFNLNVELYYKKLAIDSCVNLIANSLVRADFRTFEKGKEKMSDSYYLFNVEPNVNQNAAEFMHKLVSKLVYENECLVIMQDEQLFIADEFTMKKYALKENSFKDVSIDGYKLDKIFYQSDVFYFKLNNEKIVSVIDNLYATYGKLIASGMNMYKRNNSLRAILNMGSSSGQTDAEQKAIEDLFNVQFKNFFEAEGAAVLPLQEGLEFKEAFSEGSGKRGGLDSRDIRALVDDIFDFASIAFHIPKGLLKGDLAEVEKQTDNYLMFGLLPIAELIEDEVNRKYYTKKEFLERTFLKVDTSMIKYVDIVQLATALDKLLSSGTHSVDENRALMKLEPLNEKWSQKHYITKNYAEAENYLKGGEN